MSGKVRAYGLFDAVEKLETGNVAKYRRNHN